MNTDNLPHRLRLPARQVAYSCRIPVEAATVALCAALGGIDGHVAGARDCNGVRIPARFNLILAGSPGPLFTRLHEALTGMIAVEADQLQKYRHLLDPIKAETILRNVRARSCESLGREDMWPNSMPDPMLQGTVDFLRINILQRPTIFLRHPGTLEILAGLKDSAERLLLVDFMNEDFVRRLLEQGRNRADREFSNLLLGLMDGRQVAVSRGRGKQGADIIGGKISCLIGASPESLGQALKSQSPTVTNFLARSAFLDLSHFPDEGRDSSPPPEGGQNIAYYWHRLVEEALWRRRGKAGYIVFDEPANSPTSFPEYDGYLQERLADLPTECHGHLSEAASWPVRFFGTFLAVENSREPAIWARLKKGAAELGGWLLDHQTEVITKVWEPSSEFLDEEEARMFRKLETRGAMSFRDLLRSYDSQKSALHKPVMERLLNRGKIHLNDQGLLQAVRKEDAA